MTNTLLSIHSLFLQFFNLFSFLFYSLHFVRSVLGLGDSFLFLFSLIVRGPPRAKKHGLSSSHLQRAKPHPKLQLTNYIYISSSSYCQLHHRTRRTRKSPGRMRIMVWLRLRCKSCESGTLEQPLSVLTHFIHTHTHTLYLFI